LVDLPAGAPQGLYSWQDQTVEAGQTYLYWLIEYGVDGATRTYGPLTAAPHGDRSGEEWMLSELPEGFSGLIACSMQSLANQGVPISQISPSNMAVYVGESRVPCMLSREERPLTNHDYVLFVVPPNLTNRTIRLGLEPGQAAFTIPWVYARPRPHTGEVLSVVADPSGTTRFAYPPDAVRVFVSDLLSSSLFLMDLTDPFAPRMLYGYAVVPSVPAGSFGVYATLRVQEPRILHLTERSTIMDLLTWEPLFPEEENP
jgi:hypothetical protein